MLNQKLRRVCRSTHKCYVCSALLYSSLLRLHLVYCHLSICVRACSLTRLLMPSSSCVGGSGMGRVDRLSGRDRGNEIIAELLLLLSLLCLFVGVCTVECVCVHVCLALFSAKIYIKIALHLTSTLLNEAHESGGRHVVCALSPSISLSHSLGHSTALL